MRDAVEPRELVAAARVADALVYAAGLAGVIAGALLFRGDQLAFALVVWVLTFIAGAGLRLAAWAAKALAVLLARTQRIEEEVLRQAADPLPRGRARDALEDGPTDPYRRWGSWH